MSLDYPYYEELKRRKHRAAKFWIAGDMLYYLGLLPALFSMPAAVIYLGYGVFGSGWSKLWLSLLVLGIGVFIFFIGSLLKSYAYTLGERDGILAKDVYENNGKNKL